MDSDTLDATHPHKSIDNFQPLPSGENIETDDNFEGPESEDVLMLRPSALLALTTFFDEQHAAREAMVSLAVESHSRSSAIMRLPTDDQTANNDNVVSLNMPDTQMKQVMKQGNLTISSSLELEVDNFKNIFKSVI